MEVLSKVSLVVAFALLLPRFCISETNMIKCNRGEDMYLYLHVFGYNAAVVCGNWPFLTNTSTLEELDPLIDLVVCFILFFFFDEMVVCFILT